MSLCLCHYVPVISLWTIMLCCSHWWHKTSIYGAFCVCMTLTLCRYVASVSQALDLRQRLSIKLGVVSFKLEPTCCVELWLACLWRPTLIGGLVYSSVLTTMASLLFCCTSTFIGWFTFSTVSTEIASPLWNKITQSSATLFCSLGFLILRGNV